MRWAMQVLLALAGALAAQAPAAAGPVLVVEEPGVLQALEGKGYGFASAVFGRDRAGGLAGLYDRAPAWRTIVDTIAADVGALRADIEAGGRPLSEFTRKETGRVMDLRWLTAAESGMRLVGIVNRLDRRDFHALRGEGGCGEVRLIYRLAYAFRKDGKGKVLSSRMPFSMNAVFDVLPDADGGCTGVARRWTPQVDEAADAGWLAGGVLDPSDLVFRQLELNAQVVRFPSGQEPEFGGQAVYLMRIFGFDGDTVSELPLENTPDTARIAEDDSLRQQLADYVRENAAAIDQGVYLLPPELQAKKVVSWSTFGQARAANHPFATLFAPEDFSDVHLSGTRLLRSPQALIERLDNGTCQGCHQSSGTAGFHFIGLDDENTSPLNRIEVGISPHLHAELPRRSAYVEAVAGDRQPNTFRPLSSAPPADWGEDDVAYRDAAMTMPCILPEEQALFGETWQCAGQGVCTPLAAARAGRPTMAQCLAPPDDAGAMFSGHPCLAGEVVASEAMPFNDRFRLTQFAAFARKASARDYTCRPPRIGVPGGMAYRQCDEKDRAFAAFGKGDVPDEICGLTGGKKFDLCVATGNFDQCLAGAVQRGNRAACSADKFCREDYICQAFPDDLPNVGKVKGVGFCSPTYFVFQMRIDNHTTPWEREVPRGIDEDEQGYRSVEVDEDPDGLW